MAKTSLEIPPFILFEVNEFCDLNCKFCSVKNKKSEKSPNLEKSKKILEKLSENKVFLIIFTGGEPTASKNFNDLLSFVDKLGMSIRILTNLYQISDETIRKIKEVQGNITGSIHSSKPSLHDFLTGVEGSWSCAMENLKTMSEKNVNINKINFTATKFNFKELKPLADKISNLSGIKKVLINNYVSFDKEKDKKFSLKNSQLNELAKDMEEINKKLDLQCVFGEPVPPCKLKKKYKHLNSTSIPKKEFGYIDTKGILKTYEDPFVKKVNILEEKTINQRQIDDLKNEDWFPEQCVDCDISKNCDGMTTSRLISLFSAS